MNTLVTGEPGSGKTEGTLSRLIEHAEWKSLVVVDPQFSLSMRLMMYLDMYRDRIVYIRLRDILKSIGFIKLPRSSNPHQLLRMQEDRDARMKIARLFLGRRALDPTTSPLIWEFLEWGLRLIQYSGSPLYFLLYCFKLGKELTWMMNNCDDAETFQQFYSMTQWSPTKIRQELSPALRVVETVCQDPAFIAACGTFDLEQAIRQRKIIVVEGQGANRETVRTISLFTILLAFQLAEREGCSMHVAVDEVENFDFATPDVLIALNTLRKQGVDITLITQSLGFEENVKLKLLQSCQRREWFRCGPDMAAMGAKDCLPMLSRNEVWYSDSRTRQVHDGYEEYEGKIVSRYREQSEAVDHYLGFSDQEREFQKKLMTLGTGERVVNHFGTVYRETTELLEEPYPWGLSRLKVEEAITEIHTRPEYREASIIGVPEMKRQISSSKKTSQRSHKSKKGAGSPITRLRQEGLGNANSGKKKK